MQKMIGYMNEKNIKFHSNLLMIGFKWTLSELFAIMTIGN